MLEPMLNPINSERTRPHPPTTDRSLPFMIPINRSNITTLNSHNRIEHYHPHNRITIDIG
jgi:hypothetical protein